MLDNIDFIKNKNRQEAILTGLPIFLGERVAAHT